MVDLFGLRCGRSSCSAPNAPLPSTGTSSSLAAFERLSFFGVLTGGKTLSISAAPSDFVSPFLQWWWSTPTCLRRCSAMVFLGLMVSCSRVQGAPSLADSYCGCGASSSRPKNLSSAVTRDSSFLSLTLP